MLGLSELTAENDPGASPVLRGILDDDEGGSARNGPAPDCSSPDTRAAIEQIADQLRGQGYVVSGFSGYASKAPGFGTGDGPPGGALGSTGGAGVGVSKKGHRPFAGFRLFRWTPRGRRFRDNAPARQTGKDSVWRSVSVRSSVRLLRKLGSAAVL